MPIHYLDAAATTEPSQVSKDAFIEALQTYGNPSSSHFMGARAKELLTKSRAAVASSLGIFRTSNDKIIFTSSGTEANCAAILGCFESKKRKTGGKSAGSVIISDGEHPSVEKAAAILGEKGCEIIKIPTRGGALDMEYLKDAIDNLDSPLICAAFMLVNNETGALYDVRSAASLIKSKYPDALLHCDAVQGFMKVKFTPASLGVDTLSASAHKIHAPRGAGILYVSGDVIKKKNISPILPGGGQEFGFRSGTENLCAIAALAAAATDAKNNFGVYRKAVEDLRSYLEEKITALEERGVSAKRPIKGVPDIMNITLPGIKSETMLNYLSGRGICVSAGSACSAYSKKTSEALTAFGSTLDEIDSSIRISLSHTNTKEDIDALYDALDDGISSLVRYR